MQGWAGLDSEAAHACNVWLEGPGYTNVQYWPIIIDTCEIAHALEPTAF